MRCLSLMLGISVGLSAQSVRSSDVSQPDLTHPDIKRGPDGAWVRLQSGGADATPEARLQISSQVRVVLRNSPTSRITYQLSQRAHARTVEIAARMLTGTVSILSSPGLTTITAQGLRSYATLELYVPS